SGRKHVTGEAIYTDDRLPPKGLLHSWPVTAPHARARILSLGTQEAREFPGVYAVLTHEDVPGENDVGAIRHDEELFASEHVRFYGQMVAAVVGESEEVCRLAAARVTVTYEELDPILTIEEAIEAGSFTTDPHVIRRGDPDAAMKSAPHRIAGTFGLGGQEHFYLETHAAWAEPGEDGSITVFSSTQHPSEIQAVVARVLKVARHQVVCESPRMGGGFGGKETQGNAWAAIAALAASRTGRPVRMRLARHHDMTLTGKRHPFLANFEVGFDDQGHLLALKAELFSNGGWCLDLSESIMDRALFHIDNAYSLPNVQVIGRVCRTNRVSNTAFRGFGGPQGMLVTEEVVDRVARHLSLPPEVVRERNLYPDSGAQAVTHYGQPLEDVRIRAMWTRLLASSEFEARRESIARFNQEHAEKKRGLAITPVKFGISFTAAFLNQAGALVLIYQDGSVQVNHGGTEMGQGLHTKMLGIACRELGLPADRIRVMPTRTDKVPNTSATAASCGSDLNGFAVRDACMKLTARLRPIAADLIAKETGKRPDPEALEFTGGRVHQGGEPSTGVAFAKVALAAYLGQVSLSATGYYFTPDLAYDKASGRGNPFHYFAYGAAVSEVEVCAFTGMWTARRADLLHDVGSSLNTGIDRGQVEGAFVQGMGWLTMEDLRWGADGRLQTAGPSTYKIPAIGDAPKDFRVELLPDAAHKNTIHGSKAVGEPPFMLAFSVREALRDAIAAFGPSGAQVPLASPATSEAIFFAIEHARAAVAVG
ncbi:MAG: xanthine dehydrogenase molybdopterin binding subunit, partial [Planctomycetota bacterium]